MKRILSLIIALLLVTGALCSCKRVDGKNEAYDIVKDLIDRSYALNQVYYGEGLPHNPDEHYDGDYYYVSEDSAYRVRNDLLVETKAVFSSDIANELIEIYFSGKNSYGMVIYARYVTGATGFLAVNPNYENPVPKVYKYDTSKLKITKIKRNEIRATVPAIIEQGDNTAPFEIEVVVTYEKGVGEWRLDSPTY